LRAAVSIAPVIDGYESIMRQQGSDRFHAFERGILEDRRARYRTGRFGYLPGFPEPGAGLAVSGVAQSWEMVQHVVKSCGATRFENRVTWASCDMLLRYSVYPYVTRIFQTPVLMFGNASDNATFLDMMVPAFNDLPTPTKKFVLWEKARWEVYEQREAADPATEAGVAWLVEHLLRRSAT
jgi:hypothetical protein